MPGQKSANLAAITPPGIRGPYWRALLESRWRARLREVTELSLAYHAATGEPGDSGDRTAQREAQMLLNRAVTARRKLADVEDALSRLAAGNFGACEQCGAEIPARLLTRTPETRYCSHCDLPHGDTDPRPAHALRRRG